MLKDFPSTLNVEQQINSKSNLTPKSRQLAIKFPIIKHIANLLTIDNDYDVKAFLTEKEIRNQNLSIKLRAKSKITTQGKPFQIFWKIKYETLIAKGVFIPIY